MCESENSQQRKLNYLEFGMFNNYYVEVKAFQTVDDRHELLVYTRSGLL